MASYANAPDILPAELVERLRQYYTGLLYIPSSQGETRVQYRAKRDARIQELASRGMSVPAIAEKAKLSPQRIRQILRKAKSTTVVPK